MKKQYVGCYIYNKETDVNFRFKREFANLKYAFAELAPVLNVNVQTSSTFQGPSNGSIFLLSFIF